MLLDILLGSKATWRILILYSESPGYRFTRPEIKKHTLLGNNSLTESLKDLLIQKILIIKKEGKTYYQLNLSNPIAQKLVDLCKLEYASLNNLPYNLSLPMREFTMGIINITIPKRLILFGSIAKRIYREDSDIDLALITKEKISPSSNIKITELIEKIEKRFKRKIQLHDFTEQEFKNLKNSQLLNNINSAGIDIL